MSVVSVAPAQKRFGGFIRPLEGVRGLASLLVIAAHVAVVSGDMADTQTHTTHSSVIGVVCQPFIVVVPIFCVMAGLLLYRQFVGVALVGAPLQSVPKYLWRRALRVLPLYWTLIFAAVFVAEGGALRSGKEVLRYLFFLQIYQKKGLPSSLVPTWTLASEAVFYLLLPILAVWFARVAMKAPDVAGRTRRVMWCIGALLVVNLGWTVYDHQASMGPWPAQYQWLPSLIGFFGAGMALAAVQAASEATPERPHPVYNIIRNRPRVVWAVAFVTGIAVGFPQLVGSNINTIGYPNIPHAVLVYLLNLVCATCVVAAVALSDHWPHFLSHRVPVVLGRLSYGTYLWHMTILTGYLKVTHSAYGEPNFWVLLLVTYAGAIVVSAVTYNFVEMPAQRFRNLFSARRQASPPPAFVPVGNGRVVRPAGRVPIQRTAPVVPPPYITGTAVDTGAMVVPRDGRHVWTLRGGPTRTRNRGPRDGLNPN